MKSERIDPLRIMLVINNMGYGGAEILVADLARVLVRRGHRVSIVVLMSFLAFEDELRHEGIEVVALGMTKGRPTVDGLRRLVATMRRWKPDVVHAHLFGSIMISRGAHALWPGTALICTAHTPFERRAWHYSLYRATDPWSDLWTNVCRSGVETYVRRRAVSRDKSRYTPNGIRLAPFAPSLDRRRAARERMDAGDRFVWLAVGSFRDEQKDHGSLLRAFARANAERNRAELWIAGTGSLLDAKRALAQSLGIADRVRFLGLRSDVPELMAAADAYVMSSAWEAFPIVLLEATASGLPIVATSVGGNTDIVRDGSSGFIVPPKDPERLADAMKRMMSLSPEERTAMGAAGREETTRSFDIERVATSWEEIYTEVSRRRSRPRNQPAARSGATP